MEIVKPRSRRKKNVNENELDQDRVPQSRLTIIKEEFGLSDLEVEGITAFIKTIPRDTEMKDVLEELIKCENLNIRQKVVFSHAIGIFRSEDSNTASSRTITIDVSKFPDEDSENENLE